MTNTNGASHFSWVVHRQNRRIISSDGVDDEPYVLEHRLLKRLSLQATGDYLALAMGAHTFGFIGDTTFRERLTVIAAIGAEPSPALAYALSSLATEYRPLPDDDEPEQVEEAAPQGSSNESRILFEAGECLYLPGTKALFGWRISASVSGPSVPCGTNLTDDEHLDVFSGQIYAGAVLVDQIARSLLIHLWNDATFRSVAREALFYRVENSVMFGEPKTT